MYRRYMEGSTPMDPVRLLKSLLDSLAVGLGPMVAPEFTMSAQTFTSDTPVPPGSQGTVCRSYRLPEQPGPSAAS